MNKNEIVEIISENADISKIAATKALDAFIDGITDTLKKGNDIAVSLPGFGSFKTAQRPERVGRNPQTGETMNIPAKTVVKFTPAKKLKDAVNQAN